MKLIVLTIFASFSLSALADDLTVFKENSVKFNNNISELSERMHVIAKSEDKDFINIVLSVAVIRDITAGEALKNMAEFSGKDIEVAQNDYGIAYSACHELVRTAKIYAMNINKRIVASKFSEQLDNCDKSIDYYRKHTIYGKI